MTLPSWDAFTHRLYTYFIDGYILGHPGQLTVAIAAAILIEPLFRDWDKTALCRLFFRRRTSAKVDLAYYALQACGIAMLLEVAFTFGLALLGSRGAAALSERLGWARITLPEDNIAWFVFSFFVYWLISNLQSYWVHRAYHHRVLWHAHRFHHSADELNFLTRSRLHPLESLSRAFNLISPLMIIDVSPGVLFVVMIVGDTVTILQHSELPWTWGWIGRWVFSAPAAHQIHHSLDENHRDTNFSICPLWDHVFGTWYQGKDAAVAYGVPDSGYDRPIRQMMIDSVALYRELGHWLGTPWRRPVAAANAAAPPGLARESR